MIRLQKPGIMSHFWKSSFLINEFLVQVPKALFCINMNVVLQIAFEFPGQIASKRSNTLSLYAFLQQLKLNVFYYVFNVVHLV